MKTKTAIIIILFTSFFCVTSYSNETDTANSKVLETYEVKENAKEKSFDLNNFLEIALKITTILALISGAAFGFPAILKKIKENYFGTIITDIYESNKIIREKVIKLRNKYLSRTYEVQPISIEELRETQSEIEEIEELSVSASKEICTLIVLLKITIDGVIKTYQPDKYKISSTELYNSISSVFSLIIDYSTSIALTPKKIKYEEKAIVNESFGKYLTINKKRVFKDFTYGFHQMHTSALYYFFYEMLLMNHNFLFSRALYLTYFHPAPIERLLYKLKIFFPPILQSKSISALSRYETLNLIHINFREYLDGENKGKKAVELYYSNVMTGYNFVENTLTEKKFIEEYIDKYSETEDISLKSIRSFKKHSPETISFHVDYDYCHNLFKKHKRRLLKLMKKEVKGK